RLGGVDVVPLIQIKQSASGVRTVPTRSLAAQVVSGRERVEREDSSDGSASSALLSRPRERNRCPDGGDGRLSGCRPDLGRHAIFAVAQLAGAHGAQIGETAIRDRSHPGPAGTLYARSLVLGCGTAA